MRLWQICNFDLEKRLEVYGGIFRYNFNTHGNCWYNWILWSHTLKWEIFSREINKNISTQVEGRCYVTAVVQWVGSSLKSKRLWLKTTGQLNGDLVRDKFIFRQYKMINTRRKLKTSLWTAVRLSRNTVSNSGRNCKREKYSDWLGGDDDVHIYIDR